MASAAAYPEFWTRAPSGLLTLTEIPRALGEFATFPLAQAKLAAAPDGDGHSVLVIPGFIAGDASTSALRRFLIGHGYDAQEWELGRNLGPRSIGQEGEKLIERLEAIHARTGRLVSLVGWSLGGIMARFVTARRPDLVRQVVTFGSPVSGDPRATRVWRLYQSVTGHKLDDPHTRAQFAESAQPLSVPFTAIYSREDGIVAWQTCLPAAGPHTEAIEVHGSHCGMAVNPAVLYAVADRLAQAEGRWRPFRSPAMNDLIYPDTAVQ